MIIILRPDTDIESAEGKAVLDFLAARPGIMPQVHSVAGTGRVLTEIYAVGDTELLDPDEVCLLYTSPSPRDGLLSRMPSSA